MSTRLQDNKILYMITRLQGIVHEYKTTRYYTWLQENTVLYMITRLQDTVHNYKKTRYCTWVQEYKMLYLWMFKRVGLRNISRINMESILICYIGNLQQIIIWTSTGSYELRYKKCLKSSGLFFICMYCIYK